VTFRLGSIPVRIRASFLFVVLLFARQDRPEYIAVAAAVVFVSILVHELGHALVARLYGLEPSIELHGMGGVTTWQPGPNKIGHGKQIFISFAGPFAGFLFFGAIVLADRLGWFPRTDLANRAIDQLAWVNVGWGILNLVPLLPMDGGNIMRSVLMILTKGRGEKPARIVSILTGALFLLWGLSVRSMWIGFLGAMFTYMNVQAFRQADQVAVDGPLAQAIEQAYVAIERQDGAAVVALLRPAIHANASPELRVLAVRLLAYGLLLQEKWDELLPMLEVERDAIGREELTRYAVAARGVGREDEAKRIEALSA
jgi:Zn-dependent protease